MSETKRTKSGIKIIESSKKVPKRLKELTLPTGDKKLRLSHYPLTVQKKQSPLKAVTLDTVYLHFCRSCYRPKLNFGEYVELWKSYGFRIL